MNDDLGALFDAANMPSSIGRYTNIRIIGRGGTGVVFLGESRGNEFEKRVAIKVLRRGPLSEAIQGQLRSERQALGRLAHPNIIDILEDGNLEDGRPYFIMPFIAKAAPEGAPPEIAPSITEFCRALSFDQTLELFQGICSGVDHAHRAGIIHCDLKPSNILVRSDRTPVILDFGISRLTTVNDGNGERKTDDKHKTTLTSKFGMGTLQCCSPEQLTGTATERSDIYMLGVLLYEVTSGKQPYDFSDPEQIVQLKCTPPRPPSSAGSKLDHLSPTRRSELDRVVLKAMAVDPASRYESVRQWSEDLRNLVADPQNFAEPGPRGSATAFRDASAHSPARPPTDNSMPHQNAFGQPSTSRESVRKRSRIYRPLVVAVICGFCVIVFLTAWLGRNRTVQTGMGAEAKSEEHSNTSEKTPKKVEPAFDPALAHAEVMWLLFAAPPDKSHSLTTAEVLDATIKALCTNKSPGVEFQSRNSWYPGRRFYFQSSCSIEQTAAGLTQLTNLIARQGGVDTATALAYAYYFGSQYLKKDPGQSFKWAQLSAAADNTTGMYLMALHYLNGVAIPENERTAEEWFRRAAERDDIRAQSALCWTKVGVVVNLAETYVWCSIAASNPVEGVGAESERSDAKHWGYLLNSGLNKQERVVAQTLAGTKFAAFEKLRGR